MDSHCTRHPSPVCASLHDDFPAAVPIRAHLCRNRHSGREVVVKLMLPPGGEHGEEFALAAKETELQQRLAGSDFVASVLSWGTIAGQYLWVLMVSKWVASHSLGVA